MSDNPSLAINFSQLTPQEIEEKAVWIGKHGYVITRIGILLSIYFVDGHLHEKRQGMLEILRDYLNFFPKDVRYYQKEGSRRQTKRYDQSTPADYLRSAFVNNRKSFFYIYMAGEKNHKKGEDPDLYQFMAFGNDMNAPWSPLSSIKCHFPPTWFYQDPESFVKIVGRWCSLVGCLHGSAGLGVLSNSGSELQTEPSHYFWLKRYPGLEFDPVGSYLSECSDNPGHRQPRSSNWLTMLGDENLNKLGGRAVVQAKLEPQYPLIDYEGGAIIRASARPSWGDGPKGIIPEAYRRVAGIIKPIRFENYKWGFMKVPEPLDYTQESLKWLRRFD